jgi:hypothetical protein
MVTTYLRVLGVIPFAIRDPYATINVSRPL